MNESWRRRDVLKGAAALGLTLLAGAEELRAEDAAAAGENAAPAGPPVNCAVIGLGTQGRDILDQIARQPLINTTAICDTYEAFVNRSKEKAPKAQAFDDYKKVLDQKDVEAVIVATPTHLHRQIVLDALQAGKHVYCEAPIAHTIDDAKAIARAGRDSKLTFAAGQQLRSNPIHRHANSFVRAGIPGNLATGYAQYRKKQSWRRPAPSPERQKEMNWRLDKEVSLGIAGEIGIHQLDVGSWFYDAIPVSVTGYGGIMNWSDGREIADTIHCVVDYPKSLGFNYEATLASSFGGAYELFLGSDSTLFMKDLRAWMIKETDSPLLGWEVYSHKDSLMDDTGIVLVAGATKILAAGKEPSQTVTDLGKPPLFYALEGFAQSIREKRAPACDALVGYQSVVTAVKANEAVAAGSKITFEKEWFELPAA